MSDLWKEDIDSVHPAYGIGRPLWQMSAPNRVR